MSVFKISNKSKATFIIFLSNILFSPISVAYGLIVIRNPINAGGLKIALRCQWNGEGMSQLDFLNKDLCIRVDEHDNYIGDCTKREAHMFTENQPFGLLHRAFSVFLFDSRGRLMLQKRAYDKPTFPGVWTNTCCSHPILGFQPSELDDLEAILDRSIPGIRSAAIRKLNHELGIPKDSLNNIKFQPLTRILYCAADSTSTNNYPTSTTDPDEHREWSWGENELDYILFAQLDVSYEPNPEEVSEVKFVTQLELENMLTSEDTSIRWSPWFRIIANKFLPFWWKDLSRTIHSDDFVDWETIHDFR